MTNIDKISISYDFIAHQVMNFDFSAAGGRVEKDGYLAFYCEKRLYYVKHIESGIVSLVYAENPYKAIEKVSGVVHPEAAMTKLKVVKKHKRYYTGKALIDDELGFYKSAEKFAFCEMKDFIEERHYCFSCGAWIDCECEFNFCPNCGKKIVGEVEA